MYFTNFFNEGCFTHIFLKPVLKGFRVAKLQRRVDHGIIEMNELFVGILRFRIHKGTFPSHFSIYPFAGLWCLAFSSSLSVAWRSFSLWFLTHSFALVFSVVWRVYVVGACWIWKWPIHHVVPYDTKITTNIVSSRIDLFSYKYCLIGP